MKDKDHKSCELALKLNKKIFYQFIEDLHPNYGVFIKVAVSLDFFILFCYLLTKPTLAPD